MPVAAVRLAVVLMESRDRLMVLCKPLGFVPGTWGLPAIQLADGENPADAAERFTRATFRRAVTLSAAGSVRHAISRRAITAFVLRGRSASLPVPSNGRLVPLPEARLLLTSALWHKALKLARRHHESA